jgi:hypothetical protein
MVKSEGGKISEMIIFHVDDAIHCAENDSTYQKFLKRMQQKFPLKDLGKPEKFLGLYFETIPGGIRLHVEPYIRELLERFDLTNLPISHSPAPTNRLSKEGEPASGEPKKHYRAMVGALLWIAVVLRGPDIGFSVIQCSRFVEAPTVAHVGAVLQIFAYLKGTAGYGLDYVYTNNMEKLKITAFVDASWASADDRFSEGGHLVFGMGGVIDFKFGRIKCLCKSSHESEVIQASRSATTLKGVARVWDCMGYDEILNQHGSKMLPITMKCDNAGAIATAGNDMITTRTKHIDIADLYIKQAVQEKFIVMEKVPTKENLADLMTKPLDRQVIRKMVTSIYSIRS